jgi:hypothetical protein
MKLSGRPGRLPRVQAVGRRADGASMYTGADSWVVLELGRGLGTAASGLM